MEKWEQDLDALLNSNSISNYQYCQIDQIVLLDQETETPWNYFTHVHFSKNYSAEMESCFLHSPFTIEKKFKLHVFRYVIKKELFLECIQKAVKYSIWPYTDSRKTVKDRLDNIFATPIKYVAANEPIGSLYQNVIPVEKSLYGSNFMGNYYIFELYSCKDQLGEILTQKIKKKIQEEICKCNLHYQLYELNDRIGNIVCRFDVEALEVKPVKLGQYGTSHDYKLAEDVQSEMTLRFHIEQEHDRLLYEYSNEDVLLRPGDCIRKGVEPNQCKTTITVTDTKTNLILFRIISDQSVCSNYRSQITPGTILASGSQKFRIIKLDGKEIKIPLYECQFLGNLEFVTEMKNAGERQQCWDDIFFEEQKYFNVYSQGQHEKAILDIRDILNKQLLWDLQEVWIIDPYLSAKDILETAVFCGKPNIRICCLTSIQTITGNREARDAILSADEAMVNNYQDVKEQFRKELEEAIGIDSDIQLEFRSIYKNHGTSFHDRYLILRYKVNKTRAWSLGTSINSVGKSHHIIQIVEGPMLIEAFFNQIWKETATGECVIYNNTNHPN